MHRTITAWKKLHALCSILRCTIVYNRLESHRIKFEKPGVEDSCCLDQQGGLFPGEVIKVHRVAIRITWPSASEGVSRKAFPSRLRFHRRRKIPWEWWTRNRLSYARVRLGVVYACCASAVNTAARFNMGSIRVVRIHRVHRAWLSLSIMGDVRDSCSLGTFIDVIWWAKNRR